MGAPSLSELIVLFAVGARKLLKICDVRFYLVKYTSARISGIFFLPHKQDDPQMHQEAGASQALYSISVRFTVCGFNLIASALISMLSTATSHVVASSLLGR